MQKQVQATIQRSIRNSILFSLIGIAASTAIFLLLILPYYQALLNGGTDLSADNVINVDLSLPLYNAGVEGKEMFDTGYIYESSYAFIPLGTDYFGALLLQGENEDRFLLVRVPSTPDEDRISYRGTLVEMTSEYTREVITPLEAEIGQGSGLFLPVYLDVIDVERNWARHVGLAATIGLFLASGYGLVRALRTREDQSMHATMKGLRRYNRDVDSLLQAIDREIAAGYETFQNMKITRNWLIREGVTDIQVIAIPDMVWMYKKIFKTKAYGVVTTSTTYSAEIFDKYGVQISISGKEKEVDALLARLAQRAPWAVIGHSAEIEALWQRNRDGFVRSVEQRARTMNQAAEAK